MPRRTALRRTLLAAGPALVVLLLGVLVYDGLRRARESRSWVRHTRDVVEAVHRLTVTLQDVESTQRGYAITGDTTYLAPYARALGALGADTAALRALTRDNPAQQRRLDALAALLPRRLAALEEGIRRRRTEGLEGAAAVVRAGDGPRAMRAIRAELDTMVAEERALLERRNADEARRGRLVMLLLVLGTLAAAALTLLLNTVLARDAARHARAARQLAEQNAALEEQALELELQSQQLQDQAAEVEAQNEELQQTTEELAQLGEAREIALVEREASEARYRALVNASAQIVWGTAPDGRLVEPQPEWAALTGQSFAEYQGTGWADALHPDDRARTLAHWEQCLAARDVCEVEYRVRRHDGAYRWLAVRTVPVLEADGTVREWVGMGADVTERRAVQAALGDQQRLTRTVAENASLALFIMDEHQQCTYMNPAAERLTGYTLAETRGRALHDVIHHTHPDGRPYPLAECPIDRALPENEREQGTETFVHKDGSFYPVAFTASPIRDETTGRPVGTVIEVRDIRDELAAAAERERLYAAEREARAEAERRRTEAEAASVAKSAFLANMSHELRTPLNAIQGHVQLLSMELHGPVTTAQRDALDRVERAQRHLLGLINNILSYARLEAGKLAYDVRAIDVAEVLADVGAMIEPQFRAKQLHYEVHPPSRPCGVWADRDKLAQVLLNLLANASKFTPAGGRVTLDVAPEAASPDTMPDTVAIRVQDTGIGIPRDRLEAVFEPFVQAQYTYSATLGGTGLGLAISRDLARGMGGDVRVESVEGEGSTFSVILRRVETADGEPTDRRSRDERRDDERRSGLDRRGDASDDPSVDS